MPKQGDRREKDGTKEVWHHEMGWISLELSGWDWDDEDEAQAQLDMDNAEMTL